MVKFFIRNKPIVRIISLVLIMALCISGLSFLTPPAEAIAITVTTVGVIISFLALCGITFASVDIATKAATAFADDISSTDSGLWSEIQNITDKVDNGNIDPNDPYDPGNLAISAMTGAAVAKIFNKIKAWFGNDKNDSTFYADSDVFGMYAGQKVILNAGDHFGMEREQWYYSLPNEVPYDGSIQRVNLTLHGLPHYLEITMDRLTSFTFWLYEYDPVQEKYLGDAYKKYEHDDFCDARWGFITDNNILKVCFIYRFYGNTWTVRYQDLNIPVDSPTIDVDVLKDEVPYSNKTKYPINNIYKALSDKIKAGEDVKIDISDLLTELQETSTENLTINQEQLLVQTDIQTTLEDIAANQPGDPFDGVPKPSPMPTIGNIWDIVSDFLEDALIWMKLWVSGFNELPQSLQQTLWAILVVVIVIGILGVIL